MDRRTFLRGAAGGSAALAAGWGTSGCAPAPIDPGGALPHGLPPASPGRDRWARVPNAFARRVTTDTPTRPLALIEGALPEDLAGHVFFQSISLGPDDTGFGGDGMVWRIDFDGDSPMITSRILRTTDYLMSQAFAATPYRFHPRGVTRLGPLGMQNQTNTALVAMAGNRLIATSDASRPWELDPATLAPVSPVGRLSDYRAIAELPFNRFLCPMIISSAHPPYDLETGEFYGVSMSIVPIPGMMYFELLVWTGEGNLRRVPVLDQNGAPLLISQSAHQLCITRHHVVILDGAGTIEFGKLFDSPFSAAAHQQTTPRPDSSLFVVDRDAIRRTTSSVVARRSVIPREAAHFMADYESSPDRLVLHVPHNSAGDFAEWVQPDDVHPATRRDVRPGLIGVTTPLSYDLGVIGRYEISARTGEVLGRTLVADDRTWGSGGLVARNPLHSPASVGDVFHANSGFPTDLAVQRVARGFADHPYRIVPNRAMPWEGVPTSLVRVDHDGGRIVDTYWYPGDRLGWTPTFVPRRGTATGSSDGYVVTVVFGDEATDTSAGTEIWVFRADRLATGPVARLGRPDLEVPLTLHSVWLDSLNTTRPDDRVDVRAELTERADTWASDPAVRAILERDVLAAYDALAAT